MILAKSGDITLLEHTGDVIQSAELLFGSREKPTRLAQCWKDFFKIKNFSSFHATLLAASSFHDIGKANDGFDRAVRRIGDQVIRHEHLSGLIVCLDEVDSWVCANSRIDRDAMLSAVISHHIKVKEDDFAQQLGRGHSFRLLTDDTEFEELLDLIASVNCLGSPPPFPRSWDYTSGGDVNVKELRDAVIEKRLVEIEDWIDDPKNTDRHRLLQAVRSGLIVADAVGSAQPRLGLSLSDFITQAFDESKLLDNHQIWHSVIEPRVSELRRLNKWDDSRGTQGWSSFQTACDNLPSRALLLAPCGSGKTLAAWRWIAAQCDRPVSRVIFLYPTRATATEGFRDYVSWAPESDAALMHGTAGFDLDGMFENPVEPGDDRQTKSFEVAQRLFAIGFWGKRVFSATVDQFLAFMQHSYAATCVLPLLADSVVVVDEAHSFDENMFSALKDFLREFRVPVLCMTATLQKTRVSVLQRAGLQPSGDHPEDLRKIAEAPRYQILALASRDEAEQHVRAALVEGKRVLWVVNQVRRAQEIIGLFHDGIPQCPLHVDSKTALFCYHSRFRLKDRRDRHREVVTAIQPTQPPALAVTTQVCEMSLDLDADMIVTEHAPITSLIQRMGRCNRARSPRVSAGTCLVYRPDDPMPYDVEALRYVDAFLSQLGSGRVNQLDLEKALQDVPVVPDLPRQCGFLTSAPYAMARDFSFRDIDEYTIPGLLDRDVDEFLSSSRERPGFVVPMPKSLVRKAGLSLNDFPAGLPKYLGVIPRELYDDRIGLKEAI